MYEPTRNDEQNTHKSPQKEKKKHNTEIFVYSFIFGFKLGGLPGCTDNVCIFWTDTANQKFAPLFQKKTQKPKEPCIIFSELSEHFGLDLWFLCCGRGRVTHLEESQFRSLGLPARDGCGMTVM